jgi:hypothetical protein
LFPVNEDAEDELPNWYRSVNLKIITNQQGMSQPNYNITLYTLLCIDPQNIASNLDESQFRQMCSSDLCVEVAMLHLFYCTTTTCNTLSFNTRLIKSLRR